MYALRIQHTIALKPSTHIDENRELTKIVSEGLTLFVESVFHHGTQMS